MSKATLYRWDSTNSGFAGMTPRQEYLLRAAELSAQPQPENNGCRVDLARAFLRPAEFAALFVILFTTSAFAQSRDGETVIVGPWAIATTYKADEFESCTMGRSAGELGITFVRERDGLLVVLNSPKWKLNRGKAYSVRLVAGPRSVDAQALAETKSVTIALEDSRLNARLRFANAFEVRGEGATLRVPLDGSSTAFQRLEACVNKRASETNPFVKREVSETNQSETNPFVKREASEANPFVASSRKP